MRTMTWEEIDKDWGGLQKRHRGEIAEAAARYCVGHSIHEVAERLGYSRNWVHTQLDHAGIGQALGGVAALTPLTGSGDNVAKEIPAVIKQFAPTESDAEEFEPYLDHYREQGHAEPVAARLARAEWAGEAAVEAGVIQESKSRSGERVNRILFPTDEKDTFELDLKMHMARVKNAAEFLDNAKVRNLRRESTCEKVAEAHEAWVAQAELVLQHQPS